MSKGLLAIAAAFLVSAAIPFTPAVAQTCPDGFPQTQGYWDNHPEAWPTTVLLLGSQELDSEYLIDNVLAESTNDDAAIILLRQLAPAKLNILSGVEGAAIADFIEEADNLLSSHWIGASLDDETYQSLIDVADQLEEFNNGAFCSLPVELTSFDAQLDGTFVTLRWSTAGETNNVGFEVEHRPGDGHAFETVEFVAGLGTTNHANSYSASIANLGFGRHTFRLRQIDLDGSFSYSSEIEVDIELTERFALTEAYPNPFNPTTNIRFSLRDAGEVTLAVYDVAGRHVRTLASGSYSAGSHVVAFRADNLPSGTYLYRLQTEAGPVTGTLLLLK